MRTSTVILLLLGTTSAIKVNPSVNSAPQQLSQAKEAFNLIQNKSSKSVKQIEQEWRTNLQLEKSELDKKVQDAAEENAKKVEEEDKFWKDKYAKMYEKISQDMIND